MVNDDANTLSGMDATALFEWSEAVMLSLAKHHDLHLVCGYQGAELVGILPVAIERSPDRHPALRAPTDFYAGRSGLLLRGADAKVLAALLEGIGRFAPGWRSYALVVLQGSQSDEVLTQLPGLSGFRVRRGSLLESPAFPLLANEDEFRKAMSKNHFQSLRKASNRGRASNDFEIEVFDTEARSAELLQHVLQVDAQSWKESSGTSITANPLQIEFYTQALPTLARAGVLMAAVLLHKGQPAAYNFGVCRDGVYCCLKLSYVQELAFFSPGRVITAVLIDLMRERGIRTYDFMGQPDAYKMQWSRSSRSYLRYSARIFNHSLMARGHYWLEPLWDVLKKRVANSLNSGFN